MVTLVTGAAGFIGTNLVTRLASAGESVVGLDNFDPYYSVSIKRENSAVVADLGVPLVEADIRDADRIRAVVRDYGVRRIAHLAGKAGVRASVESPSEYVEVNIGGTTNLLEAARACEVERFVMASTSSLYAGCPTMPFQEDYSSAVPSQPYAASKRSAELLGATYSRTYGMSFAATRFFTVYGRHARPDMMPYRLAESIKYGTPVTLFEGELARDWTHVDDICRGLCLALDARGGFEIFNLGRGRPEALSRFIEVLSTVADAGPNLVVTPRPPTEMLETFADITKAQRLLGYAPTVNIEDGVEDMWSWYDSLHSGGPT